MDQYGDTPGMLYFFGTFIAIAGLALVLFGSALIWRGFHHSAESDESGLHPTVIMSTNAGLEEKGRWR
jgi:hypothetical protein